MLGVVVFGLNGIWFAIQSDVTGIERNRDKGGVELQETAFVTNLSPGKGVEKDVYPSGAVGVGDGLG